MITRYAQQLRIGEIVQLIAPQLDHNGYGLIREYAKNVNAKSVVNNQLTAFKYVSKTTKNNQAIITVANKYGEKMIIDFSDSKSHNGYKLFKHCDKINCNVFAEIIK